MLDFTRRYIRRTVLKTYRYFKHPRRLKRNRLLKWFSKHFLDKRVWKPTQHTLAGGLAVGMFISSILFPGQMPVAVILAGLFRVNVPVAIVACWWSNPVTFAPMIVAEVKIGEWFLHLLGKSSNGSAAIDKAMLFLADMGDGKIGWASVWPRFYELLGAARELYIGALVVALALSVVSYIFCYGLWAIIKQGGIKTDDASMATMTLVGQQTTLTTSTTEMPSPRSPKPQAHGQPSPQTRNSKRKRRRR